jgi:hypothetical protein
MPPTRLPADHPARRVAGPAVSGSMPRIVQRDTIVVTETMSQAQVMELAQREAQAQVGEDDAALFASPPIMAGRR